jgi:hypothetical protein
MSAVVRTKVVRKFRLLFGGVIIASLAPRFKRKVTVCTDSLLPVY